MEWSTRSGRKWLGPDRCRFELGNPGAHHRRSPFAAPFGGFKESGLGHENGMDGIRDFTETKSVYVELSGEPRDPFKLG